MMEASLVTELKGSWRKLRGLLRSLDDFVEWRLLGQKDCSDNFVDWSSLVRFPRLTYSIYYIRVAYNISHLMH